MILKYILVVEGSNMKLGPEILTKHDPETPLKPVSERARRLALAMDGQKNHFGLATDCCHRFDSPREVFGLRAATLPFE